VALAEAKFRDSGQKGFQTAAARKRGWPLATKMKAAEHRKCVERYVKNAVNSANYELLRIESKGMIIIKRLKGGFYETI